MKHKINSTNTKQMLAEALIVLSNKKDFSKITISELVSYCNINRKTFYYHFTDIYDLLEWHLNNEVNFALTSCHSIMDYNTTISYAYNYMNQHTYLKNFIKDSLAREKITQLLYKAIYPKSCEVVQKFEQVRSEPLDSDFKEFLAKNMTRIIILSTFDTIEHPDRYEIEKLPQYISMLFRISTNGHL